TKRHDDERDEDPPSKTGDPARERDRAQENPQELVRNAPEDSCDHEDRGNRADRKEDSKNDLVHGAKVPESGEGIKAGSAFPRHFPGTGSDQRVGLRPSLDRYIAIRYK